MMRRRKKKSCAHLYLAMRLTARPDGRFNGVWACKRCEKKFGKPQLLEPHIATGDLVLPPAPHDAAFVTMNLEWQVTDKTWIVVG